MISQVLILELPLSNSCQALDKSTPRLRIIPTFFLTLARDLSPDSHLTFTFNFNLHRDLQLVPL